ncbi:HD-GYP domain, c-di-GMP phosphodiesterase class II (Or its inactivated variant) [Candidatus Nitrotoga sp. BS]|uniref:HD-GYP domain-containing protein n=1 Tax=Candidatus Nitrotoga sp. BS TaxID=2890408 RepID=UPI001EF25A54|nr:HD-GYP domain-containing protein [Candidatus Nitrotoga sp. BS]CAH1209696.1 HD-GYP domain, c-di-GMP phosphodiesterase class II (Or its inactivated variant) [Candidatus Nitrotoga sp. BS]
MKIEILSSQLKIGMFVSDLDRPWLDTPFLLQGFLIENDKQIRQLQKYCKFVFIDWDRSAQGLQSAKPIFKRKAEPASQHSITPPTSLSLAPDSTSHTLIIDHSAPGSVKKKPADVLAPVALNAEDAVFETTESAHLPLTGTTPQNVNELLHAAPEEQVNAGVLASFSDKIKGFFKSKENSKNESDVRQHTFSPDQRPATPEVNIIKAQRPGFIPTSVELTTYNDVTPVEEELTPASKAYALTEGVLNNLVQDLHSDKNLVIEEVEVVIQDVVDSMVRNPNALMLIMKLRQQDNISYGYGLQTAVYLIALGRHIGLPKDFLERLGITGLLLDIGNIKLPTELLQKNDRLTQDEFEIIKSHVRLGLEILKETPNLHGDILEGIAQHHERENGSGYPAGISKGDICLFGRMAAIVNSFTALTNTRFHTKAVSAYEALKSISTMSGEYYLDSLVEQFVQTIGIFPVGSLVELSSGEVAIVISQSKVRRLKPRVLIISSPDKSPSPHPTTLDLLGQSEMTAAIHILRGLPTGAYDLDVREYYLT